MIGITSYGAYIPRLRLNRMSIMQTMGWFAPALIMVGLFMMKEIRGIDFTNMQEAFPAFIIIVMIALSYSISTGLAFGFISFVLIKTASGRIREVKPAMWIIAIMSVLFLAGGKISDLIKSII